jgi:hypothetical protein
MMDNEQLDRDREEHRDWLEGRASDQLEREAFEREQRAASTERHYVVFDHARGGVSAGNRPLVIFTLLGVGTGDIHRFAIDIDQAVLAANSILSEVEIVQRPPADVLFEHVLTGERVTVTGHINGITIFDSEDEPGEELLDSYFNEMYREVPK